MKKAAILTIVLIIGTLFTSCKSDDGTEEPVAQDPIIGSWKLTEKYLNGELLAVDEETKCEYIGVLTFTKEGNLSFESYDISDDETTCELSETGTNTWKNNGGESYTINDESSAIITFSNNNNTFSFTESEIDGETLKFVYSRE